MSKRILLPVCALSLVVIACSKEEPAAPAAVAAAEATKPAEATPPMPTGEPVDTCAMLAKADAEALLGALSGDPKAETPQGSLLGGCSFWGKTGYASISARPAGEYDATVKASTRDAPSTDLSGLGAAASSTKSGIFVKVDGKPYFVHVLAGSMKKPGQFDAAMGESVARKLKL